MSRIMWNGIAPLSATKACRVVHDVLPLLWEPGFGHADECYVRKRLTGLVASSERELRAMMGSYSGCCVAAGARILRGSLHAGMLPVKPHLAAGSVERLERVCCMGRGPSAQAAHEPEEGCGMFVRSTEAELAPDRLDDLVGALRPAIELVSQEQGYVGLSLLANRASGAIVILTYWQSPEAVQASEARSSDWLSSLQANVPGLKINQVDQGEFVLDERVVPPRVNTFAYTIDMRVSPDQVDQLVKFVRESLLAPLRAQPGFCGALMSANRESGRTLANTIWDSVAEMEASEAVHAPVRMRAQELAGKSNVTVGSYEAVLLAPKGTAPA